MNRVTHAALVCIPLAAALHTHRVAAQSAERVQAARAAMAEWTKARNYAAPADAPYSATDVTIRTPAGITLAGTLTMPLARTGRVAAVITVTGSGGQDRDGNQPGMRDYQPFREIADTLSRRGVAVLRMDDRGMGGSELGPLTVTTADFADDIRAGISWLRSRPEIDPARIVIIGHSEGGIIAPMVAATDSLLAGIVIMAGTASPGRAILKRQQEFAVDSMARLTGPAREAALAQAQRATDSLASSMPWFRFFVEYDPTPTARKVITTPALILHGEQDYQVPVADGERLASVMREAGNGHVTVCTFARTNHLFTDDAGVGLTYARLPSFRVRREVLGTMVDWLTTALARP
jgi:dipeptidyl aminopeptidase/acylaminoacyl peptidase